MKKTLMLCIALSLPLAATFSGTAYGGAASVQCKDGTTTKGGQGACSHHGGRMVTRKEAEAAPPVKCKDGSSSKGGKGACSHHGGTA